MKEKLFTTKSSRFKINPKLNEYIGQTCDIKHNNNEMYVKRKNWKIDSVNNDRIVFVSENNIEQLELRVSSMTDSLYKNNSYIVSFKTFKDGMVSTIEKISVFIKMETEYQFPKWFDLNEFVHLSFESERNDDTHDFKCVITSYSKTEDSIGFIAKYLSDRTKDVYGAIYGKYSQCCVWLDKDDVVRVEFGYAPDLSYTPIIHKYNIDQVFVERYELS